MDVCVKVAIQTAEYHMITAAEHVTLLHLRSERALMYTRTHDRNMRYFINITLQYSERAYMEILYVVYWFWPVTCPEIAPFVFDINIRSVYYEVSTNQIHD